MPQGLAARIRARYPEQYADLNDQELEQRVLTAYPQYRDLAPEKPPTPYGMTRDLATRVGRMVPEPVRGFMAEMDKPIVGPLSGTDIVLGGPLLGGGVALASRLLRGAKPAGRALTEAITPAGVNPAMKVPRYVPRNVSRPAPPATANPLATVPTATREALPKPTVSTSQFRPSTSRRTPAARIPGAEGLTRNDVQALEATMGPGARITAIKKPTSRMVEIVEEGRRARTAGYKQSAEEAKADFLSRLKTIAKERGGGEAGAVSLGLLKDIGRVANQLRVGSYLSGAAIPKNILGSASAIGGAAFEGWTTAPIREALRVPTNLKTAVSAFRQQANPSAISGAGGVNIPGRIIGAIDETTQQALRRAGTSEDDVQRLLLTRSGAAPQWLDTPVGRAILPFQRTPFNVLREGISGQNWNSPRKAALSLGMMGGGAAGGRAIDESNLTTGQKRLALGLLAAAAGPRAVPTMVAAGLAGAGRNATAGLSPIPEWTFPSSLSQGAATMTGVTPAAVRVKETLEERRRRRPRRRR